MKIISFQEIMDLGIRPSVCYEWAETMIKNKKNTFLPPKVSLKPFDGVFCNIMPSMVSGESANWEGIKVVTRYPDRIPSLESNILLMNAENGAFLALLDGIWITAMRTGAVAAHSIILFAKRDFKVIGMMGLGNVARATLLVLSEMMPEKELHIRLLRYKGQEEAFAERFSDHDKIHFSFVDTAEQMVRGADVVISGATYLPYDVCKDECFEKGVLVLPIHTLGFTNCDLFFDKVFADDEGHVKHFKNFSRFKQFAEVSDVVEGINHGREHEDERILVYNIGISIHDIFFAASIYRLMENKGLLSQLPEIDMRKPNVKFWV